MLQFLAPGYNLESFFKAFVVSKQKGFFPYDYFAHADQLDETTLPTYETLLNHQELQHLGTRTHCVLKTYQSGKLQTRSPPNITLMSQSIPTGCSPPPGQPLGISSKTLPGWSGFDFGKLPWGREFDKSKDYVEIQTFCLCIGFISDKYRVSQKMLKNGEHYIVDFQFKLC